MSSPRSKYELWQRRGAAPAPKPRGRSSGELPGGRITVRCRRTRNPTRRLNPTTAIVDRDLIFSLWGVDDLAVAGDVRAGDVPRAKQAGTCPVLPARFHPQRGGIKLRAAERHGGR